VLGLLSAASALAGVPVARAAEMARVITGSDGSEPVARGHSGLNHDGVPLQICVSIDADGAHYRLLGDPASDIADIGKRFGRSLAAAEAMVLMADAEALRPLIEATLQCLVGHPDDFDPTHHPDGVLWLAGQFEGRGLALYVDARDGGIAPAKRLRTWFERLAQPTTDAEALLAAVAAGRVMSAGVEGVGPGYARAKVYWRLAHPVPLADSPIALFGEPAFARVVLEVLGERTVHLDAIVLSAGLALPNGTLTDVKLDICCCPRCVHLDPTEAVTLGRSLAAAHGLPAPDLAPLLDRGELAFIGFGLTRAGEPRLNFYVKPRLEGFDHGRHHVE
jgi:hypothetical protein